MKYVIIGIDGPDGPAKRPQYRPEHLARLRAAESQGHLVIAGPFADGSGSLIVLEAESLAAARAFAEGDPYFRFGVFARIEVRPFTQVLPAEGT